MASSLSLLVQNIWYNDFTNHPKVLQKLTDCGISSLSQLHHAITTPAPADSLLLSLAPSSHYQGYVPMINYLICTQSNGRWFKTETLENMVRYIETEHGSQDDFPCASPLPSPPSTLPYIVVIGWGSLLTKFGEGNARLNVIGEELQLDPVTYAPINTSTAAFKIGGPPMPVELSRVSMDGRLTLVVDKSNGKTQVTWTAVHKASTVASAAENLRAREGTTAVSVGRVDMLNPSNDSQTGFEHPVREWMLQFPHITGAVWAALPSNFEEQTGLPFSVANAQQYLSSLQGNTLARAKGYLANLPNTLKSSVLDALQGFY